MTAQLHGLDGVLRNIDRAVAAMQGPAAHSTVHEVTARTVETAKGLVRVDTGELRDSIHAEPAHGQGVVAEEIIADSDHAAPNEFGTSTMSAQAFIRPALHQAEADLPRTARTVYRRTVPGLS